jgi:fused signal recognition particle receptor
MGLSFYWYARLVVMMLGAYELCLIFTNKNKKLSLCGMLVITFSAAVQWWYCMHVLIYGQIVIVLLDKFMNTEELHSILREEIEALLNINHTDEGEAEESVFDFSKKPYVIMVVGVNGVGKTTTIGKLASRLHNSGKKVVLGAADTFRAAAVDQLVIWSQRAGVPIIKQEMGSDPASVAFDTLKSAVAHDADVVLIDTAGRLHNKINLMNELTKIKNVMKKVVPDAPHEVLLVLDGSTGQNAYQQAKEFTKATDVTALAVTKLDGTAKGGVVIGISDQFKIPVKFIGVGEKIEDLQIFDKKEFVASVFKK